jgi:Tfp pilus assembly protein PilN
MIQFNLLPDIKIQYLRANRQKHTVVLVSSAVTVISIAILAVLLVMVYVLQKKNIADLSRDIKTSSGQLQSTPDLDKILTVQNQLKALPALHDEKPVANRFFDVLGQATPPKASNIRTVADYVQHTITISGNADSLNTINVYIDRLKATTYRIADESNSAAESDKPAFSQVTLSSFGRDNDTATYTITFNFDEAIFSELNDVSFSIGPRPTQTTDKSTGTEN